MKFRGARPGALALEIVLYIGVAAVAVFGLLRTLLGSMGFGGMLPGWVWGVGERLFGSYFLGEVPSVSARLVNSVEVHATPELYAYGAEPVPSGRGEFSGPFEARVSVFAPDFPQRFGLLGGQLLAMLLALGILLILVGIVRTLRREQGPFIFANAKRLRLIAWLVGAGGTASALLVAGGQWLVLNDAAIAPFVVNRFEFNVVPLLVGSGIFVFAEVFRRGAAMHSDLERVI
ncbi:hypothetical protein GCM10009715_10250 [Paeniglutamicibacter psychrophenolicus]|nr:DUF2975 domain-containing protein [Paeniglutamicibacter psychrophenolicus]